MAHLDKKNFLKKHQIYFVEKKNGASECTEVQITEYGAAEPWPIGFFDQSQSEAGRIIKASMEKRKKEPQEVK